MISFNKINFYSPIPKTGKFWLEKYNDKIDTIYTYKNYIREKELLFNFPDSIKRINRYYTIITDLFIDNEEDGDPVFLSFNSSLRISSGCTLAPRYRCKGLYILVNGDLIVDGTITMKQKGCKGEGRFVGFDIIHIAVHIMDYVLFIQLKISFQMKI